MKRKHQPAPGGPDAQWSADGQWWWDGDGWTQMWQPPRGLTWDGQSWVRAAEAPVFALHPTEPVLAPEVHIPPRESGPPRYGPPRRTRRKPRAPKSAEAPSGGQLAPPRYSPPEPRVAPTPRQTILAAPAASPRHEVPAPPSARPVYAQAASTLQWIPNRTAWIVAAAMILVVAGIFSVMLAIALGRQPSNPAASQPPGIGTGRLTPAQVAKTLTGHRFTRDVVPPELADSAPLHDVFVPGAVPGLIGELSTTTSDLGGNVTFYVFADAVWAEAFFENNPPPAFGCGVCTSMSDATPQDVGDKATSYVLYRNKVGGQSWIATTTYALSGFVVVDGLYFPVNVASSSPSGTDRAVATAYTRAALQLLSKMST